MKVLTNLALHFAARNVQALLDFITALDAKLDAYVAKQDAKASAIDNTIVDLVGQKSVILSNKALAAKLQSGVASLTK